METKAIKSSLKFALGLGIVGSALAASAFSNRPANVYGYNYSTNQWIAEDDETHICVPQPELTCKFEFQNAPAPGETPDNTSATPLLENGSYEPR